MRLFATAVSVSLTRSRSSERAGRKLGSKRCSLPPPDGRGDLDHCVPLRITSQCEHRNPSERRRLVQRVEEAAKLVPDAETTPLPVCIETVPFDPMRETSTVGHDGRADIPLLNMVASPGARTASRIATSSLGGIGGRPSRLPSLRGPRKAGTGLVPWIIARSNSANTPIIWNMALPDGVVVSMPC